MKAVMMDPMEIYNTQDMRKILQINIVRIGLLQKEITAAINNGPSQGYAYHTHTHSCTHALMHTHTHSCTHTHTHTHAHTHTRTHVHTRADESHTHAGATLVCSIYTIIIEMRRSSLLTNLTLKCCLD